MLASLSTLMFDGPVAAFLVTFRSVKGLGHGISH